MKELQMIVRVGYDFADDADEQKVRKLIFRLLEVGREHIVNMPDPEMKTLAFACSLIFHLEDV